MFPIQAKAGGELQAEKIKFLPESDGTAVIVEDKEAVGSYTIPTHLTDKKGNAYPVSAISPKAYKGSKITYLTIPASITSIGEEGFKESKELKIVEFDSLSTIKETPSGIFEECKIHERVMLPHNIEKIGDKSFYKTALTYQYLYPTLKEIGMDVYGGFKGDKFCVLPSVEKLASGALAYLRTYTLYIMQDDSPLVMCDGVLY